MKPLINRQEFPCLLKNNNNGHVRNRLQSKAKVFSLETVFMKSLVHFCMLALDLALQCGDCLLRKWHRNNMFHL